MDFFMPINTLFDCANMDIVDNSNYLMVYRNKDILVDSKGKVDITLPMLGLYRFVRSFALDRDYIVF